VVFSKDMKMKKMLIMLLMAWTGAMMADGAISVTKVEAHQRYPWNGLVDIVVTIQGSADDIANAEWTFVATNCATGVAVPVVSVSQNGSDVGSTTSWTRRYIWNAAYDVGVVKIDDLALTVDVQLGVQLWETGPYWAKCNVGASKPEEYGYYFWWGDTVGYKRNTDNNGWVSVKDGTSYSFSDCPTSDKNNSQLLSEGYIDSTGNLVVAHDAATAHLGAPWRVPTDAEFSALISNCTTTWTVRNGVYGRLVTGKGAYASKSIFLPAAGDGGDSYLYGPGTFGYFWSSSPVSGNSYDAWYLDFGPSFFYQGSYNGRCIGRSVRPLRGFAK